MVNTLPDYIERGDQAMQRGDWSGAGEIFSEARRLFPQEILAYHRSAWALMNGGELGLADDVVAEMLARFPNSVHAHQNRAELAMRRKDWSAAREHWAEVRRRFPKFQPGYARGVTSLINDDDLEAAADLLSSWMEIGNGTQAGAYKEGAHLIVNRVAPEALKKDVFQRCVRHLIEQPLDTFPEGDLSAIVTAMQAVRSLKRDRFEAIYPQLLGIWKTLVRHSEERTLVGRALGFIEEEPGFAEIEEALSRFNFSRIQRLYSWETFHRGNVQGLLAYARHLAEDGKALEKLPEAAGQKLKMLLSAHDFRLFRRLQPLNFQVEETASFKRPVRSRLKIAVCVSGQLRGFRTAFESWKCLGLEKHETDYFVHAWRNIGRRYPHPRQSDRIFHGTFLRAYEEAAMVYSMRDLERDYPSLFRHFGKGAKTTEEELLELYRAKRVVLEDDDLPPFNGFDNPMKMYYKVEKAWDLVRESGVEYDLVIRIRPDKIIDECTADWVEIFEESRKNAIFYADFKYNVQLANYIIGDQFGVATPELMEIYSTAFSKTQAKQGIFAGEHGWFRGHANFALAMAERGIEVRTFPDTAFGQPCDPERLAPELVLAELERDAESRNGHPCDALLIPAAKAVVAEEQARKGVA